MRAPIAFVVPGSIDGRTGGYEYDRRLVEGLRSRGWRVDVHEISSTFPRPDAAARTDVRRRLTGIPSGSIVIVDGLAYGAIPDAAASERARLSFAAIVHLPLADDVGLEPNEAAAFEESERRALVSASLVIATGPGTCATLASRYGVPADRIVLALPGTDPAPAARGSDGSCVHLVSVGAITRGKGQQTLVSALALVPGRDWRLTLVGSVERDVGYTARVRDAVEDYDLDRLVTFTGELDRRNLDRAYDGADVFALATVHETYGMAVAEAIARGLPVVSTTTGAIPQIVGDRAGRLVAPGDADGLASALCDVIGDAAVRSRMRAGAREAARRLPSWDGAVDTIAAALDQIAS